MSSVLQMLKRLFPLHSLVWVLPVICMLVFAPTSKASTIHLSDAELAYIAAHPKIRVSSEDDYPPFDYIVSGEARGYSIDLMNLIAERVGLNLEYVSGYRWAEFLQLLQEGKIDIVHTASRNAQREAYALFSDPYFQYRMHFIVRKGEPDIHYVDDLADKVFVTSQGWTPHTFMSQKYPEVRMLLVKNFEEQIQAVLDGRADVMLGGPEIFNHVARGMGVNSLKVSGWFKELDQGTQRMFHFMTQESAPELRSIINKGIASVTPEEVRALRYKWFGITSEGADGVTLSAKEKAFVARKQVVHVGNQRNFAPFDFSASGNPQGYSIDMLNLLAARSGLKLKYVTVSTKKEMVDLFNTGTLDLRHTVEETKKSAKLALFSKPYYRSHPYYVVAKDAPEIRSFDELKGKRIAVTPWDRHYQRLLDRIDDAVWVPVPDLKAQMEAVAKGRADILFSDDNVYRYMQKKYSIDGLNLFAWPHDVQEDEKYKLQFKAHNSSPELISILNKAIATVTPGDIDRLNEKWFGKKQNSTIKVPLSLSEQTFVAQNPVVILGGGESFEPYVSRNPDGTLSGHDVELARMIGQRTGLNIKFAVGPWADIKRRAQKKEIDGLASAVRSKAYKQNFLATNPYFTFMNFVFVKRGNEQSFKSLKDLEGKRFAVQRGNALYENILEGRVASPHYVYVDRIHDLLNAVVSGKADYTILDETAYYVASQIGLRKMITDAFPVGDPSDLVFQLRKDRPELVSIFNKGLRSIPTTELNALRNRWFYANEVRSGETLLLSEGERRYLQRKEKLKVCVDVDWAPYSLLSEDNVHSGMSQDYLELFSKRVGIPIESLPARSWSDSLKSLQARECDFTPMVKFTLSRSEFLDFTTPYISFPYVVVTKNDQPLIRDLEKHQNRTFAVLHDFAVQEDLVQKYPHIQLLPVRNPEEGLQMIQTGKAFGYVGATAPIVLVMRQKGITDLKINGKLSYGYNLAVGSRNDEPILRDIFQKAVDSLSQEDHRRIQDRWLAVKVEKVTDYRLLVVVLSGATLIILLVVYWNRKIQIAHAKTEKAMKDLNSARDLLEEQNKVLERLSVTDRLTQIYNRSKMDDAVETEIRRAHRHKQVFGVILFDIDYFKMINDTFGHKAGDMVLVELAHVMSNSVRVTDIYGRWGGEEFLIICTGTNLDGTKALAEKLRVAIEKRIFPVPRNVTASFGVTIYNEGDTVESLIDRADKAMYQAKHAGRNVVSVI